MTNATDALRALLSDLRDLLSSRPVNCLGTANDGRHLEWPIRDEVIDRITKALATPAGSASGEVQRYFRGEYGMVAAGPEYPHRDGDTYWVAEQDYAALQAEVAQLQAALAEARRDAERWRSFRKTRSIRAEHILPEQWDAREDAYIAAAEADARDADTALHQRKENGHAG